MHVPDEHWFGDGDEPVVEEMLLFSADTGGTAKEVTHAGIVFGGSVTPLFEGSIVTKPVPVMVEGVYKVFNRATSKYEEVHITADDIRTYHANTPRDVAMNFEHKRGDPVGWLRLRDTAVCKPIKTAQGERLALFASMELFPDAADRVKRGVYRDGSIELRPHTKEIIGHALTDFPIMRHTQFYSDDVDEPVTPPPAEPAPAPAAPAQEAPPQMDFAEQLAKYGLKPEDLEHLPALIKKAEEDTRAAQLVTARATVQQYSSDAQGRTFLSGQALEAAAQLLVFGQNHPDTEIHFGEGDQAVTTNPAGLLETLLKGVAAVQVFGETPGPSAEAIEPVIPDANAEPAVDVDRVKSIAARIKQTFNRPE